MAGIVHVVLVTWTSDTESVRDQAAQLVDAHLPSIPGVRSVRCGVSVSDEGLEGGFDWLLVVEFEDRAALAGYLPHPEHRPVADFLGASSSKIVVFDLES